VTPVRSLRCDSFLFVTFLFAGPASAQGIPRAPRLHAGQTLIYQLEISGSRSTKVESSVTGQQSEPAANLNSIGLLQVNLAEIRASGFYLKTYLSDKGASRPSAEASSEPDKLVEVLVSFDGTASGIKGLDQLSAAQQYAWTVWLNRFTTSMMFPNSGVHQGQRWRTSEPETASSLIAGLSWEGKYEYVKQDACPLYDFGGSIYKSRKSQSEQDICAVIFVRAQLRQKSSLKDATPQEYKLRSLSTRGTATGTNETVLYISMSTGILIRSTEDVQQSMDATVALQDGSNKVRYVINAKSHSQVQLLPDAAQDIH